MEYMLVAPHCDWSLRSVPRGGVRLECWLGLYPLDSVVSHGTGGEVATPATWCWRTRHSAGVARIMCRSSGRLLRVLAILVSHFAFRPFWKKAVFVAAGLAMMVVKNGVRIASLTLLANYVDPAFLYGKLHHQGGVVFFLLGLGLLLPIYWLLKRGEQLGRPGAERIAARGDWCE